MHAARALRREAVAAVDEAQERASAGGEPHLRADAVAVRRRPLRARAPPSAARGGETFRYRYGGAFGVGDEQVEAAVVVEVGDGDAAAVARRVDPVPRRLVA